MLNNLVNLLFPKCCLACKQHLLKNEEVICFSCRDNLPFTMEHTNDKNTTMMKFYGRVPLEFGSCMLYYSKGGIVQRLLHNLKYNNHSEISNFLGKLYSYQLEDLPILSNITEIIPVPLHKKKLKKRGYNQVTGFAEALSKHFNIPINDKLLIKRIKTTSQTKKNRFQRLKNNTEEFALDNKQQNFETNHFLLIDDILTTGGTLEACSKILLKIPNSKITILCLASTI